MTLATLRHAILISVNERFTSHPRSRPTWESSLVRTARSRDLLSTCVSNADLRLWHGNILTARQVISLSPSP